MTRCACVGGASVCKHLSGGAGVLHSVVAAVSPGPVPALSMRQHQSGKCKQCPDVVLTTYHAAPIVSYTHITLGCKESFSFGLIEF